MKRVVLITGIVLLALLSQAAPESVATPIRAAVSRPAVEIILSSAPSSGTVVTLDLPADLLSGDVPTIDRPGQPHHMQGVRR